MYLDQLPTYGEVMCCGLDIWKSLCPSHQGSDTKVTFNSKLKLLTARCENSYVFIVQVSQKVIYCCPNKKYNLVCLRLDINISRGDTII